MPHTPHNISQKDISQEAIPHIFDLGLLHKRKRRVKDECLFLQERASRGIESRIADIKRTFKARQTLDVSYTTDGMEFIETDPESRDLITSVFDLHCVNDLPGILSQTNKALCPDGFFVAALLGGETLHELREVLQQVEAELLGGISPRVHPMIDIKDAGALLHRAGFKLPVIDRDVVTVSYSTIFQLMFDLRGMGQTNSLVQQNKTPLPRSFFPEAGKRYYDLFAQEDGYIPATFEILYLSGWKEHDSQQQPLKPGSAEHSLTERLKHEYTT